MENEVLKLILSVEDKSVIKATQEAKRLEKEIKALVATEKVLGKEHEIVKQKTIEIKRKLQDYANISSQKAVPTLKKLIQAERTLSLEVDKNTAALTRNTKATKLAADASNQYGTYSVASGKKLNTFNMQVQQTGYQLQDFVVQLQSGTSFFTAFGQQGSQLAGIFGPAGAVFGAVIAIGSAIGAIGYNALTASGEVKEFGEEFGEAKTYLDAFKDSLDLLAQENGELEETFGNYTSYIRNLEEAALSASESLSRIELGESVSALSKKLDDDFNPKSEFAAIMTCNSANEACPLVIGAEKRIPITFEDPKAYDNTSQQAEKYMERSLQIATELFYVFSQINL